MRIIAGNARGTKLFMVPGKHVRPTADRIKESLFQVIGPFFHGGKALDLFAGTGNLGLEALSRGIDQVVFVDSSIQSVRTVQRNLEKTRFLERATVWKKDARRAVADCAAKGWKFDLIFLDPPYHLGLYLPVLQEIDKHKLLQDDGVIVAEHAKDVFLPEQLGSLRTWRDLEYKEIHIRLYGLDVRKEGSGL